jgi:hypothetical protein
MRIFFEPAYGPRFFSLAAFVDHLELNLIRIPEDDLPPMGPMAGHNFLAHVLYPYPKNLLMTFEILTPWCLK